MVTATDRAHRAIPDQLPTAKCYTPAEASAITQDSVSLFDPRRRRRSLRSMRRRARRNVVRSITTAPANATPVEPVFYTSEQVSAKTGGAVSAYWLEQKAREEEIPAKKFGRSWRWDDADIEALGRYCHREPHAVPKQRGKR